jgi:hypothetical protein
VPLLHEAMTNVKQLDAFVHNFYRSNAQAMGEWKTAGHVERQPNGALALVQVQSREIGGRFLLPPPDS